MRRLEVAADGSPQDGGLAVFDAPGQKTDSLPSTVFTSTSRLYYSSGGPRNDRLCSVPR